MTEHTFILPTVVTFEDYHDVTDAVRLLCQVTKVKIKYKELGLDGRKYAFLLYNGRLPNYQDTVLNTQRGN
jgi:hypothetical protein